MRIRNIAVLPAVVTMVSIVANAISIYAVMQSTSKDLPGPLFVSLVASLLPALISGLVFAIFFLIVLAESLGLVRPEVRAIAAIISSVLTALYAAVTAFQFLILVITVISRPSFIDSAPKVLASRGLDLVEIVASSALLAAFALEKRNVGSRAIPKVAGVLAIATPIRILLGSVLFYNLSALRSMYHLVGVFSGVVLVIFFVALWKCWKPELSIHENVVR